jgi:hypothetical protein
LQCRRFKMVAVTTADSTLRGPEMTAVHRPDGTDFNLRCDGCGLMVRGLGAVLHRWDLAWSVLRRYGWVGERSDRGPHGCPRCARHGAPVA